MDHAATPALFGQLGRLDTNGDRLTCHLCGGGYRSLGQHAVRAHGLSADAYRATFGLRQSTGLVAPSLRELKRELAARTLGRFGARHSGVVGLSFEERSVLARGRQLRLEARLDPRREAMFARRSERLRQRIAAGELPRPGGCPLRLS
jgi:hypothetical protein